MPLYPGKSAGVIHSNRRRFLRDGFLIAAGVGIGMAWPRMAQVINPLNAQDAGNTNGAEARLRRLGVALPNPPTPVAIYVPAVRVGNMVYSSGHGPSKPDGSVIRGKVGADLTLEQGQAAARLVGINVLASVRGAIGSLDNVVRLVKVLGMVNCTSTFTQQPSVINGFSQLMVDVFGEQNGKGARSAVGMGSLPGNIAVEIEAIFQVKA